MLELYQSEISGEYYFQLKKEDGSVALTSEGYKSKNSSKEAIRCLTVNVVEYSRYAVYSTATEQTCFSIKAANGKALVTSKLYDSPAEVERETQRLKLRNNLLVSDLTSYINCCSP
jgi:uncharacterized protein YegP (UPF0339 family)